MKTVFANLAEVNYRLTQDRKLYREFLRVPAMSAGLYVLPAGGTDLQKPHHEDEMYYVVRGRACFKADKGRPGGLRRQRDLRGGGSRAPLPRHYGRTGGASLLRARRKLIYRERFDSVLATRYSHLLRRNPIDLFLDCDLVEEAAPLQDGLAVRDHVGMAAKIGVSIAGIEFPVVGILA